MAQDAAASLQKTMDKYIKGFESAKSGNKLD
jgi:hypothetical protein